MPRLVQQGRYVLILDDNDKAVGSFTETVPGFGATSSPYAASPFGKRLSSAARTLFSPANNSTLQSGHAWTGAGTGAVVNLNYTADAVLGTQCIQVASNGLGNEARAQLQRQTAVNLTGKHIVVWAKCLDNNLFTLRVKVGSGASAFLNFNYATIEGNPGLLNEHANLGEWVPYVLKPADLNGVGAGTIDFTAIQDWMFGVTDNGLAPSTVLFGGIWLITPDPAWSAHGVISISFDDGFASQSLIAKPTLDSYGFPATAFIIRDVLGVGGAYMNLTQVQQMKAAGWDIELHADTVANHNQNNGFVGMAEGDIVTELLNERSFFLANGLGPGLIWASPKGFYDPALLAIAQRNALIHCGTAYRTCESVPVGDPSRLHRQVYDTTKVLTPNTTPGSYQWMVDQIFTYGGWLIFSFHDIVNSGATSAQILTSDFNTLMAYIAAKGVPVRTIADVLGI